MGKAGEGKQWHHIVEKHATNELRFGPRPLHNTANVIRIDEKLHVEISAHYSRKYEFTGGQTFREWLSPQTFEAQREIGIDVLRQFGAIP